jgi:hypothetical protein
MNRPVQAVDSTTLSRELADFLIELSIGLHKNAIYPPGHPLLGSATAGIMRRLGTLFGRRDALSIGVARRQLIIEGVATEEGNPVLRDLAARLHRHHLGAVKILPEVDAREMASVLAALAVDIGRRERPIGMEDEEYLSQWPNVRLLPLTFDQLALLDGDGGGGPGVGGPGEGGQHRTTQAPTSKQLWVGLAKAALKQDDLDADPEPAVVARALNEGPRDENYEKIVVDYLLQLAEELKHKGGAEAAALQMRLSAMLGGLDEGTRERILQMGGDALQRRKFMLDASQALAVDAVMDLVTAAAGTPGQSISHSMVRMLSKLAHHAREDASPLRDAADGELRGQVAKLIKDWELDDPNPDAYRQALERMASEAPVFQGLEEHPSEPSRLLAMGFEIDTLGEPVWRAVDAMLAQGELTALLDLLDKAPPGWMREAVWHYVASPAQLHAELLREPIAIGAVARLASRLQLAAVDPLLDALEMADDRTATALTDILSGMGVDIGQFIVPRLASARWPLLRAFLAMLGRLPEWPAGSSPLDFASHPDPAVRREVLRVLLRSASTRSEAIVRALADGDERVVRMAIGAAMSACPPEAAGILKERAQDEALTPDLRALGVRALAQIRAPETRTWLIERTLGKKRWYTFRRPLAPTSPEMLAALSGLAAHWASDTDAQVVLDLARRSSDSEVAAAASIRSGGSGDE